MGLGLAARHRAGLALRAGSIATIALALVVLALAVLAGCGSPAPSTSQPTGPATDHPGARITASLGIYSGRPDPAWELDEAETAVLLRMLADLPVASGVPPEGGLGYHGFLLVVRTDGQADQSLVAYRGAVAVPGAGARRAWADPTRSIERYLLETGRSLLAPAELAAVEADLGTP